MGKHAIREPKKDTGRALRVVKAIIFWLSIFLLMTGAATYLYAKILEARMQAGPAAVKAQAELSDPVPQEPVNFLLLGSDTRGEDSGRSDTLMVLRVNPAKKHAYLLSIPRDMRVKIHGRGRNKINAAFALGGPALVIKTVEDFTGLELNHYVVVDFNGFKRLVNALGGIDVTVEKRMRDRSIRLDLKPGTQHLEGEEALKYVRFRKDKDSDFGRIRRQQTFLRAVMKKVFRLGSVLRLPQIAGIAADNVETDLGLSQMIAYGRLLRSLEQEDLEMAMLPGKTKTINRVSYVIPDEEKVAWMIERVLRDKPLELTQEEIENANVRIDVKNGSGIGGLARRLARELSSSGFRIVKIGNAATFNHGTTQIFTTEDGFQKAKRVQAVLGIGEVVVDGKVAGGADAVIIVGRDYATTSTTESPAR